MRCTCDFAEGIGGGLFENNMQRENAPITLLRVVRKRGRKDDDDDAVDNSNEHNGNAKQILADGKNIQQNQSRNNSSTFVLEPRVVKSNDISNDLDMDRLAISGSADQDNSKEMKKLLSEDGNKRKFEDEKELTEQMADDTKDNEGRKKQRTQFSTVCKHVARSSEIDPHKFIGALSQKLLIINAEELHDDSDEDQDDDDSEDDDDNYKNNESTDITRISAKRKRVSRRIRVVPTAEFHEHEAPKAKKRNVEFDAKMDYAVFLAYTAGNFDNLLGLLNEKKSDGKPAHDVDFTRSMAEGITGLMAACFHGKFDIVKTLIGMGASTYVKDHNGLDCFNHLERGMQTKGLSYETCFEIREYLMNVNSDLDVMENLRKSMKNGFGSGDNDTDMFDYYVLETVSADQGLEEIPRIQIEPSLRPGMVRDEHSVPLDYIPFGLEDIITAADVEFVYEDQDKDSQNDGESDSQKTIDYGDEEESRDDEEEYNDGEGSSPYEEEDDVHFKGYFEESDGEMSNNGYNHESYDEDECGDEDGDNKCRLNVQEMEYDDDYDE